MGVLLSHVHSLVMSSNHMRGTLPAALRALSHLRMVELATMPELTGPLPTALCALTALRRLCICRCDLVGPIPSEVPYPAPYHGPYQPARIAFSRPSTYAS